MSKKKTIMFTIEHKEREFIPKCFLAYELVRRGYRVYMGTFSTIDSVAKKIEPSIFFHKSTFVKNSKFYKSLGHKFVFMDEEGGITTPRSSTESFCEHRYNTVNSKKNDAVFLSGERFEKYLRRILTEQGVEFFTTGWPRVDLWREEYRYLYSSKIQEIKKTHGNYFLLITSFGMTNEKTYQVRLQAKQNYYINLYNHKYKALLNYLDLIKKLSKLMKGEEKLIIRPHPSESIDDWNRIAKDFTNVYVVRDGDIAPWILASESIIQYGSTTATQASLNGITCIQYKIDYQDGITDTPSFELCKDAQTPQEVYELLQKFKGKRDAGLIEKTKKFLREEMAFDEDQLAVTKIANALDSISHEPVDKVELRFYEKLRPYLQYCKSYAKIYYYKLNKFASAKKTIIDKIPGGIQEDEASNVVESFNRYNGDVKKINCEQVCKDLILIEGYWE